MIAAAVQMAKPQFGAIPGRAVRDRGLTDGEFRILATVALFDRLSSVTGKGQGAWASHETMSVLCGANYSRFSTAIHKLMKEGYLTREPRATNRKQFTYRILYTDDDALPTREQLAAADVRPEANNPVAIVCRDDAETPPIVCRDHSANPHETAENDAQYIPLRVERDSAEAGKEIHLKVRIASALRGAAGDSVIDRETDPVNVTLAKFERQWRENWTVFRPNLTEWRDWLWEQYEEQAGEDNIASARAQRLGEMVEQFMELWEFEHGDAVVGR